MKKILLVLSLISVSVIGQTISFETSEGYALGNINGQGVWTSTPTSESNIENQVLTDEMASDGTMSLKIIKEEAYDTQSGSFVGAFYNPETAFPLANFTVSFDLYINALGNIYQFNPVNTTEGSYVTLITFGDDGKVYTLANDGTNYVLNEVGTFQVQTWYNVRVEFNALGNNLYIDDQLVGSGVNFGAYDIDQFRFAHNNAGGFAYVDNVKFNENLAVEDIAAIDRNISTYPNPVNDVLFVKVPQGEEVKSTSLYNILGKQVNASLKDGELNVSALSSGIYVLQVTTDKAVYSKKIIKK